MQPKFTMRQIYGDNAVYTPRTPYSDNPWMLDDCHQLDALTAREVLFADIPVLVHEATQTKKAQRLFEHAGLPWHEQAYQYRSQEQYLAHLKNWADSEKDIVCQYLHAPDQLATTHYWMDAEAFNRINSKVYLDQLLDTKYVPKRYVVPLSQVQATAQYITLPVVLKPGDESPTSGGYGVMICHTKQAITDALRKFQQSDTSTVIVEELLHTAKNYSCQFVYAPSIGIQFLGASLQITTDDGIYKGNIIVEDVPKKVIDVGRAIMQQGVEEGFIGIAGFDLIVTTTGDVQAIDLNFRQNGSTALLMFWENLNGTAAKYCSYVAKDNKHFYKIITDLVQEGGLLPLSYYDGDDFDDPTPSRFACMWYDTDLSRIEHREQRLL
ncbi:ATP-grasp domain-containing protein [Lysinibacillus alkalisoli]|uniref:ATP-grasp domain-containing protein n=1 Tax=Lysinibacillus alkalisoli TaxID=1911548 RepID=A0A917D3M4_9BACI|nr:ATP-grasp domain-containing protein [Lysinibacillus alkalisoli]GGG11092.1 ATP-grasp domain-containing protein [Lysinibacillus alkalisoli]